MPVFANFVRQHVIHSMFYCTFSVLENMYLLSASTNTVWFLAATEWFESRRVVWVSFCRITKFRSSSVSSFVCPASKKEGDEVKTLGKNAIEGIAWRILESSKKPAGRTRPERFMVVMRDAYYGGP